MIQNYKTYAQELYKIKVSTLPVVTDETQVSMTALLFSINQLRSQLRQDLAKLGDEYMLTNEVYPDTFKNIKKINEHIVSKLHMLAYNVKKKIKAVQ